MTRSFIPFVEHTQKPITAPHIIVLRKNTNEDVKSISKLGHVVETHDTGLWDGKIVINFSMIQSFRSLKKISFFFLKTNVRQCGPLGVRLF